MAERDEDALDGATRSLPFHRTTAWLAGLAIGGVLLLVFGIHPPASTTSAASAYSSSDGIGGESGAGLSDGGTENAASELSAAEAAKRLDQLRTSRTERLATGSAAWVNPVPSARYTSCFCERWGTMHAGIDLAAPLGTPIGAVGDGVVLKAGPASGFGLAIYILHENGDVTVYGHMYVMDVKTGDIVHAGQQIAEVGSNGQSTGPHLHLEVHIGGISGQKVDPIPWLAARGIIIS
ncbi:murein DD-endopeptidase MepM/ murein hydrolase activator NlpD [Antricoccus suffuscus]|uniref:Murein DD-endopeptidase MepM/ murein hydrolase activator NlpD n=2 Tax=Antricoccus suffuscus TaxID=1629062 RepID=A0A2T0ZG85_9ACTN|nr:murein DD-endopeptidase MepM/ murein hydrolase activator NlpD [Antricoccus suffuscus]